MDLCILIHIFMRISWRTRICKNIPRPWRPWPTGEMVYCECGTTNKKQGEYLEAGGRGLWGGSSLKIFTELRVGRPTFLHMNRIPDSRVSIWYLYLRLKTESHPCKSVIFQEALTDKMFSAQDSIFERRGYILHIPLERRGIFSIYLC